MDLNNALRFRWCQYFLVKASQTMRKTKKPVKFPDKPHDISVLLLDDLPITDLDKYRFLEREMKDLRRETKRYLPHTDYRFIKRHIYKLELIKKEMREIMERSGKGVNISIIAAVGRNGVIGNGNEIPWKLPADMAHFKNTTMGHHVIMGRKTYESIGKPLPGRTNIIITRNEDFKAEGCIVVNNTYEALELARTQEQVFVIGGGEIYRSFLALASSIHLTEIEEAFEGDAFFPKLNSNHWREVSRQSYIADPKGKNKHAHSFVYYERIPVQIDERNL